MALFRLPALHVLRATLLLVKFKYRIINLPGILPSIFVIQTISTISQGQATDMDWTLHTNFQILFLYIVVGGGKEKQNRIS